MPGKSSVLHETNVTSNVPLLAYGGEGELAMDGEGCHIGASFACYRGDNPHNCVKKVPIRLPQIPTCTSTF